MKMYENESGKKVIETGTINDAIVYASKDFTALSKDDLEFTDCEYIIKCDSSVYPGVTNFEQHICNKAEKWMME